MSTIKSWRSIVDAADPDFQKEAQHQPAYKFSGNRKFEQPKDVYGTNTGTAT